MEEKSAVAPLMLLGVVAVYLFHIFIYYFDNLFVFNSHPSVSFLAPHTGESLLGEPPHAVQILSVLMFFFSLSFFFWFLFMRCWTRLVRLAVFVCFWMQESAKAALGVKDCQVMTDRSTQTDHPGPEVGRLHTHTH